MRCWHTRLLAVTLVTLCCATLATAETQSVRDVIIQRQTIGPEGGEVKLGDWASIVFAPQTFAQGTDVTATLNPDAETLVVETLGDLPAAGHTRVEVDLSRFPKGLTIQFKHQQDNGGTVSGIVTAVAATADNAGTVTIAGKDGPRTLRVDADSVLLVRTGKRAQQRVTLHQVFAGDEAEARYARGGLVEMLEADCETGEGEVKATAANRIFLASGELIEVNPRATIELTDGNNGTFADLHAGQPIQFRCNPVTKEVWWVKVVPPPHEVQLIHSVTVTPSRSPLQPGDHVVVLVEGVEGGSGRFDIPGVAENLPLAPVEGKPGEYHADYTVPAGAKVKETKWVVRLTDREGRTDTREATEPLQFASAQPEVREQPGEALVAPKITEPAEGAEVGDNMVVKGTATPNASVHLRVDYQSHALIFVTEGTLTQLDLKADANGNFASPEIATTVRTFLKGDVTYTITAVTQSADGQRRSDPTVVTVNRKR